MPRYGRKVECREERTAIRGMPCERVHAVCSIVADDPGKARRIRVCAIERWFVCVEAVEIGKEMLQPRMERPIQQGPVEFLGLPPLPNFPALAPPARNLLS